MTYASRLELFRRPNRTGNGRDTEESKRKSILRSRDAGDERLKWLDAWSQLDRNASNSIDFAEFCEFFELRETLWSQRLFATFQPSFEGTIQIREFITHAWTTCNTSPLACQFLAFRLLSRRGDQFDARYSCLDIVDLRTMLAERYALKRVAAKKKGVMICRFIDTDGSGAIGFEEFQQFGALNPVFLACAHLHQQQLRRKLFGVRYWERQTKRRKKLYHFDKKFTSKLEQYTLQRWGTKVQRPTTKGSRFAILPSGVGEWCRDESRVGTIIESVLESHRTRARVV